MARVTVTLCENERDALVLLAEREHRNPREQARLILRRELERLGLLENVLTPPQNKREDTYAS